MLLVNLLAAHVKRFRFTPRKYGILLVHAGLIFLLVGQFMTEIFQVESTMRIEVGETKNYSEAPRRTELAVMDVTDPDKDKVVVIPESVLAKGGEIRTPDLPFALRVERYLPNSMPAGPMTGEGEKIKASGGHRAAVAIQSRAAHHGNGLRRQSGGFDSSRFRQGADRRLDGFHMDDAVSRVREIAEQPGQHSGEHLADPAAEFHLWRTHLADRVAPGALLQALQHDTAGV